MKEEKSGVSSLRDKLVSSILHSCVHRRQSMNGITDDVRVLHATRRARVSPVLTYRRRAADDRDDVTDATNLP